MWDLPAHLSNLNSLQSPPSASINPENEEAFWDFMHTDQLFENFGGISPAAHDAKEEKLNSVPAPAAAAPVTMATPAPVTVPAPTPLTAAPTPAATSSKSVNQAQGPMAAATLESFLAAFANDAAAGLTDYRFPLGLSGPFASGSTAPTPSAGIDTASIMPGALADGELYDENGERISGAKKLKSLGAGPAEIEEDKRRRNTEASARFRAKKKEREQALEQRAKELEAQVAQLAADKSSLENENKLLKAIVLGSGQAGADQLQGALAAFGVKRKRDE